MKYNKILAVGVTGALLLSITGSVQPLNQAKALSTPQTSATNTLDVKNLHDGIYSIDAIIINAPWLLNNMIDIDKTRLIVKDGQYKVELNTKYFEDVFFVYHMWNLKYLDSGAEKDAQITGWHDTNSPGYEVNTEASRAVEYFRNYPDRYAFPKTIVYPVDKSKIDSTNELDTYIICDCGTYKTQRCIYREKLVLKFATLKPIELDYSKEKVTAKEKIRDLSFLNGEEFNDFNRKIDQAKDEKEIQNLVDQAITQDNANKEAKTKALAEIGKLANLNEEEKAEFKEKINKTDSAAVANEVLKQAREKDKANKELKDAKEKAKALIDKLDVLSKEEKDNLKAEIVKMNSRHEFDVFFDKVDELLKQSIAKAKALADLAKLANLDEKEKESFKAEINNAQEKTKVDEVLNQAKEKDKANKELKDAKTKALAEIGKLANLDEKEKDDLKAEINKAQEKTKVEEVLNQAKEKEKAREEIEKLANAIENAKAEINKLANLADGEKASFNEEIDIADSIEKVNDALARAREKDKEALAKVKAKVKEEIEKLANLTKDQKEAAKEKIDKASSIEEVDEARTKVKAKAAIEKFANLTKEQKDNLKEEIDKADSLEQVKEVFVKAKEKDKANKEAKEAKTKALEELGKLANLDEKEKENFKELINQAEDKKEISNVLEKAKAKNTANKAKEELKLIIEKKFQDPQQKAAVLKDLEKLKTLKEVEQLKADIEGSVTIGEHNDKKLAEVKAKALAEIDKLDDLSKEGKDNLKAEIDKINSIDGFNKFFDEGKEKLKAEIDKFDDLSKDEKDNLKAEIDKTTNSIEAIDKFFDKVKEKLKAVIDKLDNLSKEEKESAKAEIYKANNAKEVNDALAKAKELDKKQRKDVTPTPDVTPAPETEAGWLKDEIGWSYQRANGSIAKAEWEMINGTWYHFDSKGYMQTGWLNLDGTWYYLNADGKMATDTYVDGYYVDANGAWVVEGWQNSGYGWWYQRANGSYPSNGWEMINGIWYYFDANGYMLKDEATPDGYYVDINGAWVK